MQQNHFIDGSLDIFVVAVAEKVPTAGGCIWLFPEHVIFHSLRAISSNSSPPHYRLHVILYHVSLPLYHLPSTLFFLSQLCFIILLPVQCVLLHDVFHCAVFKYNWVHSLILWRSARHHKLLLVCFFSLPIVNELVRTLRHLWFIPPARMHKSSTHCAVKNEVGERKGEGLEGEQALSIS